MPIIPMILILVLIGVLLYFVNMVIPMVPWMKTLINVVVALLVILWLLSLFGFDTGIHPVRLR